MTSGVSNTSNFVNFNQLDAENLKKKQQEAELVSIFQQKKEAERQELYSLTGIDSNNFGEGTTVSQNITGGIQAITSPITMTLKLAGGLLGGILGPVFGAIGSIFGGNANGTQQAGGNNGNAGQSNGSAGNPNNAGTQGYTNADQTQTQTQTQTPKTEAPKTETPKAQSPKTDATTSCIGTNEKAAAYTPVWGLNLNGAEKFSEKVRANVEEYYEAKNQVVENAELYDKACAAYIKAGAEHAYNKANARTIAQANVDMFQGRIKYLESELADLMKDIEGQNGKNASGNLNDMKAQIEAQLADARTKLADAQKKLEACSHLPLESNEAVTQYAQKRLAEANKKTAEKMLARAEKNARAAAEELSSEITSGQTTIDKAKEQAKIDREDADKLEAAAEKGVKDRIGYDRAQAGTILSEVLDASLDVIPDKQPPAATPATPPEGADQNTPPAGQQTPAGAPGATRAGTPDAKETPVAGAPGAGTPANPPAPGAEDPQELNDITSSEEQLQAFKSSQNKDTFANVQLADCTFDDKGNLAGIKVTKDGTETMYAPDGQLANGQIGEKYYKDGIEIVYGADGKPANGQIKGKYYRNGKALTDKEKEAEAKIQQQIDNDSTVKAARRKLENAKKELGDKTNALNSENPTDKKLLKAYTLAVTEAEKALENTKSEARARIELKNAEKELAELQKEYKDLKGRIDNRDASTPVSRADSLKLGALREKKEALAKKVADLKKSSSSDKSTDTQPSWLENNVEIPVGNLVIWILDKIGV